MKYRLPFVVEIPLRFADADALGHVNNVAYFRFLEQTRVYFMQKLRGISGNAARDFPYVVAHAELDYLEPLDYTDTCISTMGVSRIGNSSFTLEYELFSKARKSMVAKGKVVMVCVDHQTGKTIPIPDDVRSKLKEYLVYNNQ